MNRVANGILLREKIFDNIWIQPAAGDAGGALGAALNVASISQKERSASNELDAMKGAYLGPEFNDAEIEATLTTCGAIFKKLSETEIIEEVVSSLVDEKVVAMQGRMEFGPRALVEGVLSLILALQNAKTT